jgi:hypothetical protein
VKLKGERVNMEKYLAGILTALMALSVLAIVSLGQPALKDYPGFGGKVTGTDLPVIVVGAVADPADVIGAVDIAVTLAELSTTKVPIPGAEPKVDGKSIEFDIRGAFNNEVVYGTPVEGEGYSKLLFYKTVTVDDTEVSVLEKVTVSGKSAVNATDTFLDVDVGGVKYKISFTPSMPVGKKVTILGKDYEIIDVSDTVLKLGETKETGKLGVGQKDSIGPYEVSVYGVTLDGGLKLTVTKEGSALAGPTFKNIGDNATLDGGNLTLLVKDIYVGYEAKEAWVILKLTWVNTVAEEGKDSPFDKNYKVSEIENTTNGLVSLELESKLDTVPTVTAEGQIPLIKVGESFEGPAGYFKLLYRGLTTKPTEKIVFDKDGFVTFNDKNRLETKVNVSKLKAADGATSIVKDDVIGVKGFAVNVVDIAPDASWVKLKHRAWENNISLTETYQYFDTGYGFAVNITKNATNMLIVDSAAELETSLGAKINTTGVVEESGDVIAISYNATNKNYDSVTVPGEATALTSENKKALSNYGSVVTLGAGRETVEIVYPDEKVQARALVGELKPAPEQVVEKYTPIVGAIGKLDTDPDLKPAERHLIIVGGPYANRLAAQFYNLSFPITVTADEVGKAMGIPAAKGNAVIEVKEGVFGAGKLVILVAGWDKADTRLAARVLQEHATRLKDVTKAKVVISGTELATATITPV